MSISDVQLTRIANFLEWYKERLISEDEGQESDRQREKEEILEMQKALVNEISEKAYEAHKKAFVEHEEKYHKTTTHEQMYYLQKKGGLPS